MVGFEISQSYKNRSETTNTDADFDPLIVKAAPFSNLFKNFQTPLQKRWYKNGSIRKGATLASNRYQTSDKITIVPTNSSESRKSGINDSLLLDRRHFHEHFDTDAYLKDFYAKVDDPAMQMVLFYLPIIIARLDKTGSLLDFGAGPTIHIAVCFREKVEKIYLADYLQQNRKELKRWWKRQGTFDWTSTLKIIATREGIDWSKVGELEESARSKVRAIFYCNCHTDPAVDIPENIRIQKTFDIITTFFTLEYCCLTLEEYRLAIQNVCAHVAPNGMLIMGGILEETWCSFGGRRFKCLYITKAYVVECLQLAGMDIEVDGDELLGKDMTTYEINGIFIISCRKKTK